MSSGKNVVTNCCRIFIRLIAIFLVVAAADFESNIEGLMAMLFVLLMVIQNVDLILELDDKKDNNK